MQFIEMSYAYWCWSAMFGIEHHVWSQSMDEDHALLSMGGEL